MAFNNNRKNNNTINTQTKMVQLYNDNVGEDSSTLRLGFWNDSVSIGINPALAQEDRSDNKVYNYEVNASVILNIEGITNLRYGIKLMEASIAAKDEKKKITNVAVEGNQGTVVKVCAPGEYDGVDEYCLALISYNKGEMDGSILYIFMPDELSALRVNFDEDNNSYKKRSSYNTQWEIFKSFIDYAYKELINGGAHGANKNLNFHMNKMGTLLETIKALVENIMSGGENSSRKSESSSSFGRSGFNSNRRRRSSMNLDDDDEINVNVPEGEDDELPFDNEVEEKPKKKSTKSKSTTKKSSKKSSKKISLSDIADDMEDDIDDMSDLD